jgi:hypothetical protein
MQVSTSIVAHKVSIPDQMLEHHLLRRLNIMFAGDEPGADDNDAGLKDAARDEQEYVRERLREELKREPTDEEMDEWLREHTEGY